MKEKKVLPEAAAQPSVEDIDTDLGLLSPGIDTGQPAHYTNEQIFNEWLFLELDQGPWWNSLPECPEQLCILDDGKAENPDSKVWSDPNVNFIGGIVLSIFHPGSEFEIRTISGAAGAPHGNQCTYDKKGKLIEDIPAAGTADLYGPNNPGGFSKHQDHDVATYKLADKLNRVADYYLVRPIW